jgi:phosphodiesterase/alkaline phosphatase D-like protein
MKRKLEVTAAVLAASAVVGGVAAAASSPAVTTGGTSQVTNTSALLHGTVNPNGSSTTYYFQWGLTNAYGDNGKPHSAGSGTKAVAVEQTAGGLIPGTTYHYRLVATNSSGTTLGTDRSFKTTGHPPPGVSTGPANQVNATGATLTGAINPSGAVTSYWFQWGQTTSYTQSTNHQTLAASATAQNVAASLQGLLAPGTIYHYRLVASHGTAAATVFGADGTFMTFPSPRPVPSVRASTKPTHARNSPYVLTTTGAVVGPSWMPHQYSCYGNVTIRFFRGTKQVAFTLAGIQPDCTFAAKTVFRHAPVGPGGLRPVHLRVVIRSIANSYLATNRAPIERIQVG